MTGISSPDDTSTSLLRPVPGIDEIETLRKRSSGRKTHRFARLCHRAGEGRGGSTERQHARCRQLCKLAGHLYLPSIGVPWRDAVPLQSIPAKYGRIRTTGASQAVGLTSDTWAGEGSRSVSQSGARRGNSPSRVRLPKSVRFPIADALKHEASANTISHRDKIVAVAVRCALRQASVAKIPLPAPQVLLTVFTSCTSLPT